LWPLLLGELKGLPPAWLILQVEAGDAELRHKEEKEQNSEKQPPHMVQGMQHTIE
jgi:hypothetical protein